MKKRNNRVKRPTKLDELTLATKQNYSHLHSASIKAQRDLLQFEIYQIGDRILALNAALFKAKERGKQIQAQIVGLGLVLEKR